MIERAVHRASPDHILILCTFLLTGLGLVTLYSASYATSVRYFGGDGFYFVVRQSILGVVGVGLFFVAVYIPLGLLRRLVPFLALGTALLCLLTFVPGIGVTKNGASRWIGILGSTYQPSELVKLALPLYLAHIFDKKKDRLDAFTSAVLPPTMMTGLFFLLIYMENNFSTAFFIAVNALVIFFLAGIQIRYFIAALVILVPVSALLVLTKAHRLARLTSFLDPNWEPLGAGYQVRASVLTVASGGFWGKGIGQGTRKLASVPEIQSDFIFAAYAEELGFLGVLFFYAVFAVFAVRGYRAALRSPDMFGRLLASGMVTVIISQALVNIAVTAGALPATGIPLPFFSAGGSALVTILVTAGLVVNISRQASKSEVPHVN
jgi:cell division protein FtsW